LGDEKPWQPAGIRVVAIAQKRRHGGGRHDPQHGAHDLHARHHHAAAGTSARDGHGENGLNETGKF
jgi:hypothetical protein